MFKHVHLLNLVWNCEWVENKKMLTTAFARWNFRSESSSCFRLASVYLCYLWACLTVGACACIIKKWQMRENNPITYIYVWEIFVHFSATQQVVVINSCCVYVRHNKCIHARKHTAWTFETFPTTVTHLSAWYIWLVLSMKKDTIKIVAHRRLSTEATSSPPPPSIAWVLRTCPVSFSLLGLINRP